MLGGYMCYNNETEGRRREEEEEEIERSRISEILSVAIAEFCLQSSGKKNKEQERKERESILYHSLYAQLSNMVLYRQRF